LAREGHYRYFNTAVYDAADLWVMTTMGYSLRRVFKSGSEVNCDRSTYLGWWEHEVRWHL